MNTVCSNRIAWVAVVTVAGAAIALPAQAANSCNFEDGLLCGWIPATTGGSGSTTVETHNGSKMAYVQHTGKLTHKLSQDFTYAATDVISFVMQAVANAGGRGTNSGSGVNFSFLNAFNAPLGSAGLYNVTSTTWLGAHDSFVDNVQHSYSFTLGTAAALAGLTPASPIAKVSVSFSASAETNSPFGDVSAAAVWFDNITVGAVPEPSESALLAAGLATVALMLRRRRAGTE